MIDLMPGFGSFTPAASGAPLDGSESDGTQLLSGDAAFSAGWIDLQGSSTKNAVLSPNGATNGMTFAGNGATERHLIYQTVSTSSGAHRASVYAKQNTIRYLQLIVAGSSDAKVWVYADLQTGTITDTGDTGASVTYSTSTIEAALEGYYKVSVTYSDSGSATTYVHYALSDREDHTGSLTAASPSFATSDSFYLWRPKLVTV